MNDDARQSTFLSEPRSSASFGERETSQADVAVPRNATFRVSGRVLARRVGGEVLLLHLSSGVYHVLNETGARVWALLENGRDLASIADAVASEYEVDPDRAAKDVQAVIARLQEEQLIAPL